MISAKSSSGPPTRSSNASSRSTSCTSVQPSGTSAWAGAASTVRAAPEASAAARAARRTGLVEVACVVTRPRYREPLLAMRAGMPHPVVAADLSLSEPCQSPDDFICTRTYDITGSREAATLADWFVGKPLVLVGLLVLGLVVRWVLHRLIDRLV